MNHGRYQYLVSPNQDADKGAHDFKIPARRASLHHSASNSSKEAKEALKRAIITHQTPSMTSA
jgi:hypothetical protein